MTYRRPRPRGIFMTDLIVALVIALALLMAMTVAASALQRGERELAQARGAARQLETALWTLQTGGKPDASVSIVTA